MNKKTSAKLWIELAAITLLVLLAGCGLPGLALAPNTGKGIDLKVCDTQGLKAECGKLAVYEDRAAQSGRMIEINFVRVQASGSPVQPDPLFYFTGGPGGAGTEQYGLAASMFAEINQHRDVVFFDQRGTGESNKLLCPEIQEDESTEDYVKRCLDDLPGDPRFYTTTIAVDDVDDIRQALGYEKINLYGVSYGVTAAQVYMNRYPEHVRSATLDHGTLLQISFTDVMARNSQIVLDRVLERCQAEPSCRKKYPDLENEFASLLKALEQPVQTGQFDPNTSRPVVLTRSIFNVTLHNQIMSASASAQLPSLIHAAAGGNWDPLANKYLQLTMLYPEQQYMVMPQMIWCFEDWAVGTSEGIARLGGDSYYLETALEGQKIYEAGCKLLPDPGESAHHGPALPSDIPVLLFSGDSDPQNPPENVAGYQEIWPNSLDVVQPGVSHIYSPAPCWNSIMAAFVASGSVEDLPLACVEASQMPDFK